MSSNEYPQQQGRRFHFVQIDVFTSQRLQGNALAVFPDARGLSDSEMQGIVRETNLQETTFVFPRDPSVEREHGVKVRIFIPEEEIPFGGHPTLGTAMVLRNRQPHTESARMLEAPQFRKSCSIFKSVKFPWPFVTIRQVIPSESRAKRS